MGLDMYLKASKYIRKFDYHCDEEPTVKEIYAKLAALFPELDTKETLSIDVVSTVAYWRKANQIHNWFVQNVQEGEDDCGNYDVDRDKLTALLNLCKDVLANRGKAKELLPTQSGFFFGGTEYDEYYWQDIENTIAQLETVINNPALEDCDLYYHSSW